MNLHLLNKLDKVDKILSKKRIQDLTDTELLALIKALRIKTGISDKAFNDMVKK